MKITSAKFIRGIIGTAEILYDGKFQVAFIGRSNVGKSTLINSLVLKKNLARSSSTPGKTIRMDFFLINDAFYFVDFPGYGYATVTGERHEKIRKMILWYLMYSEVKNRVVILVIDAKVGITDYDSESIQTFKENQIPYIVVANKMDNVPIREKENQIKQIQGNSRVLDIVQYSSKLKYGRDDLMKKISFYIDANKLKSNL